MGRAVGLGGRVLHKCVVCVGNRRIKDRHGGGRKWEKSIQYYINDLLRIGKKQEFFPWLCVVSFADRCGASKGHLKMGHMAYGETTAEGATTLLVYFL